MRPRRRLLTSSSTSASKGSGLAPRQIVLSRALVKFKRFDLTGVPARQRQQALLLQLSEWTPYLQSAYLVQWQREGAAVWCWDDARLAERLEQEGLLEHGWASAQRLPESTLLPVAEGAAAELQLWHLADGYEAQAWRAGELAGSRFWHEVPSDDELGRFLLQHGIAPLTSAPHWQEAVLRDRPTLPVRHLGSGAPANQREVWLYALALFGVLTLFLWQFMRLHQLDEALARQQVQRARIENDAQPVILARRQALDANEQIQQRLDRAPYPTPLELMQAIARCLPGDGAALRDFDLQGDKLRIVLRQGATPLSRAEITHSLGDSGDFDNIVQIQGQEPNLLVLSMRVKTRPGLQAETESDHVE